MTNAVTETDKTDTLYCANHPTVATALRCNRCGKPICTRCAVRTPVGYRCRECLRSQQQVFETVKWYDYLVAALVAVPIGALSAGILGNFGFFTLFLAPMVGGVTAEVVRAAVRKRRGRYFTLAAAAAFALGCLAVVALPLLAAGLLLALGGEGGGGGLGQMLPAVLIRGIWPLVYTVLATATLYARLRGISV